MAARITDDELIAVFQNGFIPSEPAIFIASANLLVDELLADKSLSEARLKEIEKYLAAHFAQISAGGDFKMRKVGDATDEHAKGFLAAGLLSTSFGQMAVMLDTTNTLKETGQSAASFSMLT